MSMLSPDRQTNEKTAIAIRCSHHHKRRKTSLRCADAAKTVPDNKNGTPGLALRVPPLFERGYAIIEITARFA
jgi:hypothetical protein